MIPEEHREEIIQSSIIFIRAITDAYGHEEGMRLWETISSTIDADIKGQVFFCMLTGNYDGMIIVRGYDVNCNNIVGMIKAVRASSGMGLKEAKDAVDLLRANHTPIRIKCKLEHRSMYMRDLREAGLVC